MKTHHLDNKMENRYLKSLPDTTILIPRAFARGSEYLVRKTIEAKTPQEVAELFYLRRYLNGEMFNSALDLTPETAGLEKSLNIQDALYMLNYVGEAVNVIFREEDADDIAKDIIKGFGGK